MSTATTLTAYAAALAVVFGGGLAVGDAFRGTVAATQDSGDTGDGSHGADAGHAVPARTPAQPVGGLAVSQDGYRLDVLAAPAAAGQTAPLSFRITGPDGEPLTAYTPEHEKDLHLVLVRRDATGFQHVHPERDGDGTWTVPLTLPQAGTYKLFADFVPAGADRGLTLATDVTVAGALDAGAPAPAEVRTATVDGYEVTLEGDLSAGRSSEVRLTVSKDGRPVSDLEPYLGAYGHLVALRDGDLAYLHVHPEGPEPDGPNGGPTTTFAADVPSAGVYRLFLDFQHGGVVRTAALSLPADGPGGAPAAPAPTASHQADGHAH